MRASSRPQAAQLRARVAGDHAPRICAARIAALRGCRGPRRRPARPGASARSRGSHRGRRRPSGARTAARRSPGRSVCAATAPGSAAEMPAPAMITRRPRMRAFLAYSATTSGSRWADITRISCRMPRSLSSAAGLLHRLQVALGAHHDAHPRRVDVELVELGLGLRTRPSGPGTSEMPGAPDGDAPLRGPPSPAQRSGPRSRRAAHCRPRSVMGCAREQTHGAPSTARR